jgi:hypothetical protein
LSRSNHSPKGPPAWQLDEPKVLMAIRITARKNSRLIAKDMVHLSMSNISRRFAELRDASLECVPLGFEMRDPSRAFDWRYVPGQRPQK